MKILKKSFVKHLVLVALTSLCICAWTSEVHAQTKNTNDVKALRNIIATQKKKGAKISTDINNKKQYKWDKTGRLKTIRWQKKNLKGKITFGTLKGLKYLNVSRNKITALDVDGLAKLTVLDCLKNNLKTLNVKSNERLGGFYCSNNRLKTLNIFKNKKLYNLDCSGNQLITLKINKTMKFLWKLDCSNNRLKKLKVSKSMKQLSYLECSNNKISSLHINGLKRLEDLYCSHNRLKKLVVKHTKDINISCEYNKLKDLDFSDISVMELRCSHNRLDSLNTYDVGSLDCSYNHIKEIKGYFGNMHTLLCAHNKLTKLDIRQLDDVSAEVDCSYNDLTELQVDFSGGLESLQCDHNPLTELEIQQPGRRLKKVICDDTLQFTGVIPEHFHNDVTDVTINWFTADENDIFIDFKNNMGNRILAVASLMLEKKSGNVWKKMEFTRNTSLKTVLLIPKEKTANLSLSLKWKDFFGKRLGKGKYRVTFFGKKHSFKVS